MLSLLIKLTVRINFKFLPFQLFCVDVNVKKHANNNKVTAFLLIMQSNFYICKKNWLNLFF